MPNFLGIDPVPYDPETFEIPTTDHRSETQSKNFLASVIAATTMRFRKSQTPGQLESNTVVYRWSDGSSTIAIGQDHYELQDKPLAPPRDKPYQPLQDSHTYLVSPSLASSLLVSIGHMTNQYTVRPNAGVVDDALEKLQLGLKAASRRNLGGADNGPELVNTTVDPELQRKEAEAAEREKVKAQRRRELAAEKASVPRGYGGRGGLSVMDLEGGRPGRRAPTGNKRARPSGRKQAGGYASDDSEPRGRGYGDDYQQEDDFLAPSDEEEEVEEEEEEEEDELDEVDREEPRSKKAKVSKANDDDSDADADADMDDDEVTAPAATSEPAARGRNRNVIEDDDDDE